MILKPQGWPDGSSIAIVRPACGRALWMPLGKEKNLLADSQKKKNKKTKPNTSIQTRMVGLQLQGTESCWQPEPVQKGITPLDWTECGPDDV